MQEAVLSLVYIEYIITYICIQLRLLLTTHYLMMIKPTTYLTQEIILKMIKTHGYKVVIAL